MIVGGSKPRFPGCEKRRCHNCNRVVWISPAMLKRIKDENLDLPFSCISCMPKDVAVMPLTAAQVAEIHATGCDMTGQQMNDFLKRKLRR